MGLRVVMTTMRQDMERFKLVFEFARGCGTVWLLHGENIVLSVGQHSTYSFYRICYYFIIRALVPSTPKNALLYDNPAKSTGVNFTLAHQGTQPVQAIQVRIFQLCCPRTEEVND